MNFIAHYCFTECRCYIRREQRSLHVESLQRTNMVCGGALRTHSSA